jgi:exosortase
VLLIALIGVVLTWAYWHTLVDLWKDWQRDANYSVGQLVPLLAAFLVWRDRRRLRGCAMAPSLWGASLLAAGLVLHVGGLVLLYNSIERYSIVVTIAGVMLLIWGRAVLWRCRWILAFLLLMVPLPGRVHNAVSGPLQSSATAGTVMVLEAFGADVDREGNILLVNGGEPLGVAESCSGLRMLTAFVVISALAAFLVDGPRWSRFALLALSVPIAIVCNVIRLSATAAISPHVARATLEAFVHDFAGIAMMPVAILMLIAAALTLRRIEPRTGQENRT